MHWEEQGGRRGVGGVGRDGSLNVSKERKERYGEREKQMTYGW